MVHRCLPGSGQLPCVLPAGINVFAVLSCTHTMHTVNYMTYQIPLNALPKNFLSKLQVFNWLSHACIFWYEVSLPQSLENSNLPPPSPPPTILQERSLGMCTCSSHLPYYYSGGSRGGSRGAQEPPFGLHLALRSTDDRDKWNPAFWQQN